MDEVPVRYRLSDEGQDKVFVNSLSVEVTESGESRVFGVQAWQEQEGNRTPVATDILLDRGAGPAVKTIAVVSETVSLSGVVRRAGGTAASGYVVTFGKKSVNAGMDGRFTLIVSRGSWGSLRVIGKDGHQDLLKDVSALTANQDVGLLTLVKRPALVSFTVSPGRTRASGKVDFKWQISDPSKIVTAFEMLIYTTAGVVYQSEYSGSTRSVSLLAPTTPGAYKVKLQAKYMADGAASSVSMMGTLNVLKVIPMKRCRIRPVTTESAALYLEQGLFPDYPYTPDDWDMGTPFLGALNGKDETLGRYTWGGLEIPYGIFSRIYGVAGFDFSRQSWWSEYLDGLGFENLQNAKLFLTTSKILDAQNGSSLEVGGLADDEFNAEAAGNMSGWTELAVTPVHFGFQNLFVDKMIEVDLDEIELRELIEKAELESGRLNLSVVASVGLATIFHGIDSQEIKKRPVLEFDYSYTAMVVNGARGDYGPRVQSLTPDGGGVVANYGESLVLYSRGELSEFGLLGAAIQPASFAEAVAESVTCMRVLPVVTDYKSEIAVKLQLHVLEGQALKAGVLIEHIPPGFRYIGMDEGGRSLRVDELAGGRLAVHFANLEQGVHEQVYRLMPVTELPVPDAVFSGELYYVDALNLVGVQSVAGDEVLSSTVDSDLDGLADSEELRIGTSLFDKDTDGDGYEDGAEKLAGSDPLDPSSNNQPPCGEDHGEGIRLWHCRPA
jgi:hypothetical protein